MSEDERTYFRQRAERQLEWARLASHPQVARAHYHLAGYYLDRAFGPAEPLNAAE